MERLPHLHLEKFDFNFEKLNVNIGKFKLEKLDLTKPQRIALGIITGIFLVFFTPLFNIIFGFFLAGYIPGTTYTLPWFVMFIGYIALGIYIILYAHEKGLYPGSYHIQQAQGKIIEEPATRTVKHRSRPAPVTRKRKIGAKSRVSFKA